MRLAIEEGDKHKLREETRVLWKERQAQGHGSGVRSQAAGGHGPEARGQGARSQGPGNRCYQESGARS